MIYVSVFVCGVVVGLGLQTWSYRNQPCSTCDGDAVCQGADYVCRRCRRTFRVSL